MSRNHSIMNMNKKNHNDDSSSLSSLMDSENHHHHHTTTCSSIPNHPIMQNNHHSSSLLLGGCGGDLSCTPSKQALTIVRGISSYLSLSDAESIGSLVSSSTTRSFNSSSRRRSHNNNSSRKESLSWSTMTPSSPFHHHPQQQQQQLTSNNADAAAGFGIQVNLSVPEKEKEKEEEEDDDDRPGLASLEEEDDELEDVYEPWRQHIEQQQQQLQKNDNQKQMIQSLSKAVMSHPESIKSICCTNNTRKKKSIKSQHYFCNDCQSTILGQLFYKNPKTLQQLLLQQQQQSNEQLPTSCLICGYHEIQQQHSINNDNDDNNRHLGFLGKFVQRIPLSILIDFAEHVLHLSLDTTFSSCEISIHSIHSILSTLSPIIQTIWMDIVEFLNPIALIHTLSKLLLLQNDESKDFHHHHHHHHHVSSSNSIMSQSSFLGKMNPFLRSNHNHDSSILRDHVISEKLYHKLSKIDTTSKVISYLEREDEALTHHAKKRVQRMMHYHVSLRPFVATVTLSPLQQQQQQQPFENYDLSLEHNSIMKSFHSYSSEQEEEEEEGEESPFMCSPKSFPQTPSSRAHVMARGSRFTEDVVFLARDHLRVEEGMTSCNDQTRAMANALKEGSRLALFNAADASQDIVLSCGQHCATKVGANDLYSSVRGMIPVLRNRYVYFEMSVASPPPTIFQSKQQHPMLYQSSLCIGLSTLDMPLNTLVGATKKSLGLCTTGQILSCGQWCSPSRMSSYGSDSTVGCLIYLDDDETSSFPPTNNMVMASVIFNINGNVVKSPNNVDHARHPQNNNVYPIYIPKEEELYPTLSLHSSQTEVFCRFSSSDILAKSREDIGSPINDAIIYAVDGSVLFE